MTTTNRHTENKNICSTNSMTNACCHTAQTRNCQQIPSIAPGHACKQHDVIVSTTQRKRKQCMQEQAFSDIHKFPPSGTTALKTPHIRRFDSIALRVTLSTLSISIVWDHTPCLLCSSSQLQLQQPRCHLQQCRDPSCAPNSNLLHV